MRILSKLLASGAAFTFALVVALSAKAGPCSVSWNWAAPTPTGLSLSGIAYGSGTYVSVGQAGQVLTSVDGVSWGQERVGPFHDFTSVAYGASRFVASGDGLFTSPDGQTWSLVSCYGPSRIDYCGGFFFGDGGLCKSADGQTWMPALMVPRNSLDPIGVAFGNGIYVCVVREGRIYTSPDGTLWTQRYSPLRSVSDIAFGNGTFLILAWDESGFITMTSNNGVTWTVNRPDSGHYFTNRIIVGNGQFLVQSPGGVLTSQDGRTWTYQQSSTFPSYAQMIYAGGQFVAVGEASPGSAQIATSPDGLSWQGRVSRPVSTRVSRLRYFEGPRIFAGVGWRDDGPGVIFSRDGRVWQEASDGPSMPLHSICLGGSTYIAIGDQGTILSSSDLSRWSIGASGATEGLYDVAYGAGLFVAVGQNGILLTSPDGETWTRRASFVTSNLNSVLYAGGLFVAAGDNTAITTSPDGVTWTVRYGTGANNNQDIIEATYAGGKYLCVTRDTLLSSQNGVSWSEQYPSGWFNGGIVLWQDTFIAPAYAGGVILSEDLGTWTHDTQGHNAYQPYSLATDGETLVGITYYGLCWGECTPYAGNLSNNGGPVGGGTSVDIYGIGLQSAQQVLFGSVASSSITVVSNDHLVAVSPPNLPGPQALQVTTRDGVCFPDFSYPMGTFYYIGSPVVEGINPVKVSTAGNSWSQIWGSGLINGSPPIDVTIGGKWVSEVEGSWRVITFTCPALPAGPADVVLAKNSGHATTLPGALLYVDPPAITSIKLLSNPRRLKIAGANFHTDVDVHINGRSVPSVLYKKPGILVAKGGAALDTMIPSGGTSVITVLNRDDGVESLGFQFQR